MAAPGGVTGELQLQTLLRSFCSCPRPVEGEAQDGPQAPQQGLGHPEGSVGTGDGGPHQSPGTGRDTHRGSTKVDRPLSPQASSPAGQQVCAPHAGTWGHHAGTQGLHAGAQGPHAAYPCAGVAGQPGRKRPLRGWYLWAHKGLFKPDTGPL